MARANPQWQDFAALAEAGQEALVMFQGPHSYISPTWYGNGPPNVPTWNYVAVHLRGTLRALPPESLRDLLDRQAAAYESRLAPKPAWTTAKMDPEALVRLMRMILPFRLDIETVDGTWKLSQNKPDAARLGAASEIASGFGNELEALAALMRDPG